MKKLKIGLIGCGRVAGVHATRLKTLEEAQMVAFSDVIKDRAKAFSKKYGGKYYVDWREMLDKEQLDIVYIAIPPFAHENEVMMATEKGINIFIEKPIACPDR